MDRLKGRAMSTRKLFSVVLSLVATDYINSQTIEYAFESNTGEESAVKLKVK